MKKQIAKKSINKNPINAKQKNSKAFLYATIGFFSAIILICCSIGFIVIPILNAKLNTIGVKNIGEFITFVQDLNQYVDEDEIVKNGFVSSNYSSAYTKFKNAELDIFDEAKNIDSTTFEVLDYTEYQNLSDNIYLTDQEMASLLANAVKSDVFVDKMGIELINEYELELEIKEISISINNNYIAISPTVDCFNFVMVGKISLKNIAEKLDLDWPYNSWFPDSVYVLTEAVLSFTDEGVEFLEYGVNINNFKRSNSYQTVVNIINSQLKEETTPFTLEQFSLDLNKEVYNRIELFASKIHSSITVVYNEDLNSACFEFKYAG